jgi:hypothetical protein
MSNFVNDAIMGKQECITCGSSVGQIPVWDEFMEWWNNLEDMVKYAVIAGVGLIAVLAVVFILKPVAKPPPRPERAYEELLRLKMMKELAE